MKRILMMLILSMSLAGFAGCQPSSDNGNGENANQDELDNGHDHASSDHSAKHGGQLLELGRSHEYHAEFKHDPESGRATVYVYDGEIKELKIPAKTVTVILTVDDKTGTFELNGSENHNSEFSSTDESFLSMLNNPEVDGKVRAIIDDKPYTGSFHHHGDGNDHDHD